MGKLSVKEPLASFIDHGHDVISKIRIYLSRALSTTREAVRTNNLWLSDITLHWLLFQYNLFKVAERGPGDKRWLAINNFINKYASELKLKVMPLPLFGDSYFSTGSFQYYKRLALRLEKEYYVISADASDPPVFWPLLLHEISHCWLGTRNDVDVICSGYPREVLRTDRRVVEYRVEEALCDVLATHLIGPAYAYSYIYKLWAQFARKILPLYPSHRFRIECRAKVLDKLQLYEAATDVRSIGDELFADDWYDEDISWSIDDLIDVTKELPELVSPDLYFMVEESTKIRESSTPIDLPTLFLSCWMHVDEVEVNQVPSTLDKTSDIILRSLEGWPSPSDT